MSDQSPHVPGRPNTDDTPEGLLDLVKQLQHPEICRTGVTCTEAGEWAVYVTITKEAKIPKGELEKQCSPFPVVYDIEPDHPIKALN